MGICVGGASAVGGASVVGPPAGGVVCPSAIGALTGWPSLGLAPVPVGCAGVSLPPRSGVWLTSVGLGWFGRFPWLKGGVGVCAPLPSSLEQERANGTSNVQAVSEKPLSKKRWFERKATSPPSTPRSGTLLREAPARDSGHTFSFFVAHGPALFSDHFHETGNPFPESGVSGSPTWLSLLFYRIAASPPSRRSGARLPPAPTFGSGRGLSSRSRMSVY